MDDIPSIPDFYRGRKILVTGATGFMGKVLLEKLLRSCPDLHTVYLLLRAKRGKRPTDRVDDITRAPLFDRVRAIDLGAFDKLRAIDGDVAAAGLALSAEDRRLLQEEVSVVFHVAASVRFDDSVKKAVLINVRGTKGVVDLALGMKDLRVLLYVSTAFSNCDQWRTEEKIYPPPGGWSWRTLIKLAESDASDDLIDCLTPKILGALQPNTYVFAKALAEQVINDHRHLLPAVILRPSIVICSFDEPFPGWVDNLNGPYAHWVGVYTGVIRTGYGCVALCHDLVPVDAAIKSMVFVAWERATSQTSDDAELAVYNCCSLTETINQLDFIKDLHKISNKTPTIKMIWYPRRCEMTASWTWFYLNILLFHLPYGLVLDEILKYKELKPMFAKAYRRFLTSSFELKGFTLINRPFDNARFLQLEDTMLPVDRAAFSYTRVRGLVDMFEIITRSGRSFLLKERPETLPKARRKLVRLFWLDKLVQFTTWLMLAWAFTATGAVSTVLGKFAR